jgi:purine-binding chemotaxis protein CheW
MATDKDVLIERARRIAGRKDNEDQLTGETLSVVEFLLLPERYAFEGKYISEVLLLKEITSIPGTPPFVMGVINLRGKVVSIINLKSLFNLKEWGLTQLNKVLILKDDTMEFGIVADEISENKSIFLNTLSPPPVTLDNIGVEYISGITPDGLILLSARNLLSSKQIIINQ